MKNSNIISTSVSLSRNLKGYKYPHKLGQKEGSEVTNKIFDAIKTIKGYSVFDYSSLTQEVEVEYMAKKYITLSLSNNASFSGFALNKDGKNRIYVNADNHIEIVRVSDSLSLADDYKKVDSIDDDISKLLEYDYDESLGYLNCDMSQIGTGLKVSVDIFMPAVSYLNKNVAVYNMLAKLGVTIVDVSNEYGMDGVYRISNAVTIGKKEESIVSLMDSVANKLLNIEKDAMDEYLRKYKLDDVKNMTYRAYGVLKNSHMISIEDLRTYMARLKFGINMGLISFDNEIDFSKILIEANEDILSSKLKTSDDKTIAKHRAEMLYQKLSNIKR